MVAMVGSAACSAETADTASSSASQTSGCVGATQARRNYDAAVKAANDQIQTDYAAALAANDASVAQAKADRDAALAALPSGPNADHSADEYNAIILAYNAKVGADGSIAHAYADAVKAAQDRFHAAVQTALDAYNATAC
jgi:hypothetical protein